MEAGKRGIGDKEKRGPCNQELETRNLEPLKLYLIADIRDNEHVIFLLNGF